MRITFIHPCVGRRIGQKKYFPTWSLQPLVVATLAAKLPESVERTFFDDRLEDIDFDAPTDAVFLSVETYTARRAWQIASEYRRRNVPVIMGGYHATLCTEEVERYADSVVVGQAEPLLPEILDDIAAHTLKKRYKWQGVYDMSQVRTDRRIFAGKKYMPMTLIEFSRGCKFRCDFCAIQSFHKGHDHRPIAAVVDEVLATRKNDRLIFFIDDNLCSNPEAAKQLMRALAPHKLRWVTQTAIDAAWDEDMLRLMKESGCQGVLVGFESLSESSLKGMNKGFNLSRGGPKAALERFRAHGLRVYGTFIFGYDGDTAETFATSLEFAKSSGLFIAAFNHITPFPGTPLFDRLKREGRLFHEAWWLDPSYRYNQLPFKPANMSPEELADRCLQARRSFYSWGSIARRIRVNPALRQEAWMIGQYLGINALHHFDIDRRSGLPLGREDWQGEYLEAAR
jgi:radical SAM superfamily enzyme YgiQ (UPF0313 family)